MGDLLGKVDIAIPNFDDVFIHALDLEQLADRENQVMSCVKQAGLYAKT